MSSVEAPLLDSALAAGPAGGAPFDLGVGCVPISVMQGLNLYPHESAFQDDIILGEEKSVFALTALGVANDGGRRVVEHLHHVDLISPSPGHLNNRIIKSPISRSSFSIDAPNQFQPNVSAIQALVRAVRDSSLTDFNSFFR